MKTNLKQKYRLTKSVELLEKPYLGKRGIKIVARIHGEEVLIEGAPADAALLLLENQLIDDFSVRHNAVVIKWGMKLNLDYLENNNRTYAERCWKDFVAAYNFSDFDAKQIVANYILNRAYQPLAA